MLFHEEKLEQLYDFILEHIMTEHGGKVVGRDVCIQDIKTSLPVRGGIIDYPDSESEDDTESDEKLDTESDEKLGSFQEEIADLKKENERLKGENETHYQRGYDQGIRKKKTKKLKKENNRREQSPKT